ncbi:MAG: hypothetical protein HN742_31225 [Lentisphaerae bacterium]|nr:hypothetical protein [Lentisphaerota bacterium]MBT4822744.1 hypothetical protein [Lentisphaerota bacterium]MBT5612024.1 hypothetical protein [Lentisphaerota bacterium]MBT7054772.1 hypothetical protein [Lentisphaerota bacterium]MBT7846383.1 hypothetical protein [Lentisphaerota bacterium]
MAHSIGLRQLSLCAALLAGLPVVLHAEGASFGGLEAETLVNAASSTALVLKDAGLSGGAGVRFGRKSGAKQPAEGEAPALSLTFKKNAREPFLLWARLLAPNSGTDSLWIREGKGELKMISLKAESGWRWVVLWQTRSRATDIDLQLFPRESGFALDRFVATSDTLATPHGVLGGLQTTLPDLRSSFPKPPILPPAEHPRVYLRQAHLPMIRERAKHPRLAEEYTLLKRIADREWDGTFPEPGTPEGGNYHRRYLSIIEANAFLYLLEEDDERGRRAVVMLQKALNTVVVADRHDVTRDYGRIIFCCAVIYDWCYPFTDEAWRKAVLKHMIGFAKMTEIGFPPKGQGTVTGHGSEAQLMREQLAAGIAVYDEYPDWYLFGAGRFFAEYVPARNMYFQAHRQHQGDSYGWSRFRWSMYATFLMDRLGAGQVFDSAQSQIPYSWVYMRRGDGQFLRDGDTFASGDYWMYPQGAMMVASYYREPTINFAFRRMQKHRPGCVSPFWMLLLYDPTVPVSDVAELPLTRYFPSPAGDIIARTGWQLGPWSNAVVAEMKGAFYHFNNHDHLDAGAFQIYYKGALATDAGCYGPYGTPYDWHWNKRSVSHNTLLIYDPANPPNPLKHDGGQNFVLGGREPRVIEHVLKDFRDGETTAHGFGPDPQRPFYSFVRADLTPAYADRATRVERSSVFLNLAGTTVPAAMLVFDRVAPRASSDRSVWLIHSVHEPGLEGDTFDIRRTDGSCNGRLSGTMLLPEAGNRRCETIGGPGREAEVFGHRFVSEKPTLESQGWRLEVSSREGGIEQRFLNVMQVMDAEPEAQPMAVAKIACAPFVGARVGDTTVLFPESTELVSGKVSVTGGGKMPTNWVVTGLAAGRWSVRGANEALIGTADVQAEETVLCFRATGVEFILTPTVPNAALDLPQPSPPTSAGVRLVAALDGKPVPRVPPMHGTDGHMQVAIEPLARALGYTVTVEGEKIRLTVGEDTVILAPGLGTATINGTPFTLAGAVSVVDRQTLVSLVDLPMLLRCRHQLDPLTGVLRLSSPDPSLWWIVGVSDASTQRGREPGRAIDGSMRSYWAAEGEGKWLQLDLGGQRAISALEIAWLHGDKRQETFDIVTSADGAVWSKAFTGTSSGTERGFEIFTFPDARARFVRIIGHGNSANQWNSVCEVRVPRR